MRFIVTTTVLSALCAQVESTESTASSRLLFTEDQKRSLLDAALSSSSASKRLHLGRSKRKLMRNEEDRKIGGRAARRKEKEMTLLTNNNIRGGSAAAAANEGDDRHKQQRLRRQEEKANVECDPNREADSGILTSVCAGGYYCIESHTSSLGGICVQNEQAMMKTQLAPEAISVDVDTQRRLPETNYMNCSIRSSCPQDSFCDYRNGFLDGGYCELCPCQDPADPTYNMCNFLAANGILSDSGGFFSCAAECHHNVNNCQEWTQTSLDDCVYDTGFDQYTKTGSVTCSSDEYCSYGCCYTIGYTETFLNGYVESNAMTYTFARPYTQDFTIEYFPYVSGSLSALAGDACTINIDGTDCYSCWKTGHCVEFDCTNIPGGIGDYGHTCDDGGLHNLIPIYEQCFFEGHGCNICGLDAGLSLAYPQAKSVVPGFNSIEYYCEDIYDAGLHRLFDDNGSQICTDVSDTVRSVCCGNPNTNVNFQPGTGNNNGYGICNICETRFGPGSRLTSPHAMVPFVGQNCNHFYFQGLLGQIHSGNCQSVSNSVAPHCCSAP